MDNLDKIIWGGIFKSILFIFIVLFISFVIVNSVTGEKVSLKDLRYEIMNPYESFNHINYYDDSSNNISVNGYNYYNCSYTDTTKDFLLADTNFFNFTSYDEFYIDYFSPNGEEIFLEFNYSYVLGNLSNQYIQFYDKEYHLETIYGSNGFSHWTNGQISLYYSKDSYIPATDRSFEIHPSGDLTYMYYHDSFFNTSLPANIGNNIYRYTIDIDYNYNAYYPYLRYYNEIWLKNVSRIDIMDYGFIEDDELDYNYKIGNRTYYMLYGNKNIYVHYNQSSLNLTNNPNSKNSLTLSCYDYDTLNYIRLRMDESYYTGRNFRDYDLRLYDNSLLSFNCIWDNDLSSIYPNFITRYVYTGFHMGYNERKLNVWYKWTDNRKFITPVDWEWWGIDKFQIDFIEDKKYLGTMVNESVGELHILFLSEEVTEITNEFYEWDVIEQDRGYGKQTSSFKIGGDWGIVDGLRKAINVLLGFIAALFVPLIDILSPIATEILNLFEPLFNAVETAISLVTSALEDVWDIIDDVLTEIGLVLTQVTNAVAGIAALLNDLLVQILAAISGYTGVIVTFFIWLFGFITDSVTFLINLLDFIFIQVGPTFLGMYLSFCLIFALYRMWILVDEETGDIGDIIKDFGLMFLLPIKLLFNFTKWVFDMIPF